ncbi:MAG: hypothetical protein KatS3mg104_0499 [Phycisphaerae bacterium]|nr:MAG: hypothetical protein KatS3mg104_0499 [Phycisphaerae bacterium]
MENPLREGLPNIVPVKPPRRPRSWVSQRTLLGLTNRQVTPTLQARYQLAAQIRVHRPNVLFVPYIPDAHPDHLAVTRIAEDARFDAKLTKTDIPGEPWYPKRIIYYFCTHLKLNINPTFCIDVSDTVDQKMQAIACYESQMTPQLIDQVRLTGDYFGSRIGTKHAEPFFSHEVIAFGGLDQLI